MTGHPGLRSYNITVTGPVRPFLSGAIAWWKCDTATLSNANPSQPVFTSLIPGSPVLGNVNSASIGSGWVGESYGNASISPPASAFAGLSTGADYKGELLKWNYQQQITASEFNGRSIDLVVEPKIFIKSGLIQ
mgnify:CR=1 FL=1